jgi:uncharacterized repeat protein (TIGR04076 family)
VIKCKITVLKRSFNKDYVEQYVEHERKKTLGLCEVFKEGQEFITDVFTGMPQGFCPWAWDDIYKSLVGFAANGNYGMWYENKNTIIACCTDGTRPVYFKIEKMQVED